MYLTSQTIANAWKTLVDNNGSNRLMGALCIASLIPAKQLQPRTQYKLSSGNLSNVLQGLFYFGDDIKPFRSDKNWYAIFSNDWINAAFKLFVKCQGMPILGTAIVLMHNENFEKKYSAEELIDAFISKFHLTKSIIEELFQEGFEIEIDYVDAKPSRKSIRKELEKKFVNLIKHDTVCFEKKDECISNSINSGEITRGPFIQPLYASTGCVEVLIFSEFDISELYLAKISTEQPISEHMQNNRIIYGAPGTGKSYKLEEQSKSFGDRLIRVTFHPDYTNAKFIGSYKPSAYYKKSDGDFYSDKSSEIPLENIVNEPVIDYSFKPGPFLQALVESLKDDRPFLLLIEEINRANAPAVFGDVLQLLDRENGKSRYCVTLAKEAHDYLIEALGEKKSKIENGIYIPENLYLWASMNSADQGVFPMDAAFKRRWFFEYLPLNENEHVVSDNIISFDGSKYKWNGFRKVINDFLSKKLKISEDRLIGPFFLTEYELNNDIAVKNKLLLYLRDDVLRYNHEKFFERAGTFYEICQVYGQGSLLKKEIQDQLSNLANTNA